MALVVCYPCQPSPGAALPLPLATLRAVAAQVRRQLLSAGDTLAVPLPRLLAESREITVNGRAFSVQWDLTRALCDQHGRAVLGICDVDPDEPDWAYVSIDAPATANRPDLALSTAAHELGHLVFDVPGALGGGLRRYRAVAASPEALERAGRGAEGRANEFMGALLAPPVPLHTRLLALARAEGLRLARAPHEGRPASPVVAPGNPPDLVAGVLAALAAEFGVTERFIAVRAARYGLVRGGV
ncbi:ImmA/IrrE family metallo-endopeptidase [Siccirubricoccus phaeus]|uniref:ImmA/IrrE family metallo-endopeptidase n=1 Tax=Siccirubricoccus phaeus TaxID=2595053 RepID=UPI0011F1AAD7|nr:hypothetical protein [Siccirubricoccus phaeus]